jgi:alkylation response protein AidB-like acyl-CoA dehydrogenase
MDFQFSADDEAFRDQVRQFIAANLPRDIQQDVRHWYNPNAHHFRRWQKLLAAHGWGAPHWPRQYGGTDWSPLRKHIFMQEIYRADAPDFGWQGLHMLGPVLIEFGSPEQKARFLPPMLTGEEFWCQGFSEPNAGSDLASLRTAAVLDGDHYVVNGQKIWTSDAADADWGFFLVRTDTNVKPQKGISFLLIKMDSPGITVRPIRSIDGRHDLNETFLDNVRVPREKLIGTPGMGWTYAKFLLEKERTASAFLYFNQREFAKVRNIASQVQWNGQRLLDSSAFARRVAEVEADLLGLEWSVLRLLAAEPNKYNLDAVVSALKLRGSALQQRITELQIEALGPRAVRQLEPHSFLDRSVDDETRWPDYAAGPIGMFLHNRAATIYGGSREVQKNIIAKLAFGA